jgi:uncharacterized delta-60 repeat protein
MKIPRVSGLALVAVALTALCLAPAAKADTLVVQPDGKLVMAGWGSSFGALARLTPDGALDPGFGRGGFVLRHRIPSFRALALEPDGRVVAAAMGGSLLTRFLADGTTDRRFGVDGIGGTHEPRQPTYVFEQDGPTAVIVRPGGDLVVAGNRDLGGFVTEAWVRRYDSAGGSEERIGYFRPPGGSIASGEITDLVEVAGGAAVGAGSTYEYRNEEFGTRALLGRFVPGSGTLFDPDFAGGAGLVLLESPGAEGGFPVFRTVAADDGALLVAGSSSGTFLVTRFDANGVLDPDFADGGLALPPIVGPAASSIGAGSAGSEAGDLVRLPDGDLLVGGETSQWSTWSQSKLSPPTCWECPQPLLARLDSNGNLDPGFGEGGLLRLHSPGGEVMVAAIEQVTALAGGTILVNGTLTGRFEGYRPQTWREPSPFVARLNPDGSYDPNFGQGGLRVLLFPCSGGGRAELRRAGCLPTAAVTLRPRGLRGPHPALVLRARSAASWAAISKLRIKLPPGLRPAPRLRSKLRVKAVGAHSQGAKLLVTTGPGGYRRTEVTVTGFGDASQVRVALRPGSLLPLSPGMPRGRRLRFPVVVNHVRLPWGDPVSKQTVVRWAG